MISRRKIWDSPYHKASKMAAKLIPREPHLDTPPMTFDYEGDTYYFDTIGVPIPGDYFIGDNSFNRPWACTNTGGTHPVIGKMAAIYSKNSQTKTKRQSMKLNGVTITNKNNEVINFEKYGRQIQFEYDDIDELIRALQEVKIQKEYPKVIVQDNWIYEFDGVRLPQYGDYVGTEGGQVFYFHSKCYDITNPKPIYKRICSTRISRDGIFYNYDSYRIPKYGEWVFYGNIVFHYTEPTYNVDSHVFIPEFPPVIEYDGRTFEYIKYAAPFDNYFICMNDLKDIRIQRGSCEDPRGIYKEVKIISKLNDIVDKTIDSLNQLRDKWLKEEISRC